MKSRHLVLGFLIVVASCSLIGTGSTNQLKQLTEEYNTLVTERAALPPGPERAAKEKSLADVAKRADAEAGKAEGGAAETSVALYRVAVLAAWKAGAAGEPMLLDIGDRGVKECSRLPQAEASRSGDCTIIKLATILATADSSQRSLRAFQAKLDGLRTAHQQHCDALPAAEQTLCKNEPVKLPAADRAPLEQIFGGFETQFTKATELRAGMNQLGVDQSLKEVTDRDRVVLYCSAVTSWSRLLDVENVASDDPGFTSLTARRNAMREQLEGSVGAVDCRDVTMAAFALEKTPLAPLPGATP